MQCAETREGVPTQAEGAMREWRKSKGHKTEQTNQKGGLLAQLGPRGLHQGAVCEAHWWAKSASVDPGACLTWPGQAAW